MNVLKCQFKQSANSNTLELYIYDEVRPEYYWEDDYEVCANHIRETLAANPNVANINIYINSVGGDVMEGYGIYQQLRRSAAYKTVYVDGFAASIASVIAMAGDKIVMYNQSMMMIHKMWVYMAGNADDLRAEANALDSMMEGCKQIYIDRSGGKLSSEKLDEMLSGADTWLTAKECLEYGLADEIDEGHQADLSNISAMFRNNSKSAVAKVAARLKMDEILAAISPPQQPPERPVPDHDPEPTPEPEDPKNNLMDAAAAFMAAFLTPKNNKEE